MYQSGLGNQKLKPGPLLNTQFPFHYHLLVWAGLPMAMAYSTEDFQVPGLLAYFFKILIGPILSVGPWALMAFFHG